MSRHGGYLTVDDLTKVLRKRRPVPSLMSLRAKCKASGLPVAKHGGYLRIDELTKVLRNPRRVPSRKSLQAKCKARGLPLRKNDRRFTVKEMQKALAHRIPKYMGGKQRPKHHSGKSGKRKPMEK